VLRRFIGGPNLYLLLIVEHIHHKLLARGMSHRQVVIIFCTRWFGFFRSADLVSALANWKHARADSGCLGTACGLVYSTWGIPSLENSGELPSVR